MAAIPVDSDVLASKRLYDKIGNYSTIVGVHARTVGVEYTHHPDIQFVLAIVIKEQCFSAPLALIVARAQTDWVDVPPIIFPLRMHLRISVDLTGRGLQNTGFGAFGEAKHVDRAMDAGLGGLYWIPLVVNRRRRAGEVVDSVNLYVKWEGNVMTDQFEMWVAKQVGNIVLGAAVEVVDADDVASVRNQPLAQMGAKEACPPSNQHPLPVIKMSFHFIYPRDC